MAYKIFGLQACYAILLPKFLLNCEKRSQWNPAEWEVAKPPNAATSRPMRNIVVLLHTSGQ